MPNVKTYKMKAKIPALLDLSFKQLSKFYDQLPLFLNDENWAKHDGGSASNKIDN